ncbi:MAG TPA: SRPBCC family protein [Pyrinomonadaceae bacterium]|jgi:choline monooxygenase
MSIFDINSDIRRAETLSSEFYTNERYFQESKEKIFARSWQLVGHADENANLNPRIVLKNFLDEPVLITKNGEDYNCLSNVCTHRGKILIENDCSADLIRCGYHGKRFSLDGEFLSMPEFEAAENFPSEKDNLTKIPCGFWNKFAFVSLNPIAPLDVFIAEMREIVRALNLKNLRFIAAKDYTVKAHWALYCENYLEGFHIPFVHRSLNEAIDYGSYTTETFRFSSLQKAIAKTEEDAFDLPASNEKIAAFYFFIFPNTMFNFYPWGLSVNIVKPIEPDSTTVSYMTYVSDETKLEKGAGADLNRVELEDQAVVESVQKGIRSRFYERGRYSPTREQGTHHFHRLIAEFMK